MLTSAYCKIEKNSTLQNFKIQYATINIQFTYIHM